MIKILVVGLSNICGGIETYMKNVVDNISLSEFSFDFINFSDQPISFENEFCSKGFDIIKVTSRKENFKKYKEELIKIYKNKKYDYIHFHIMSYEAFERIRWAQKFSDSKIIVHSHNAGFGKNAKMHTRILHYIGEKVLHKEKYFKVACGNDAGKWMYKNKEFELLNNGINYDKYKFNTSNRYKIRNKLNIDDRDIVLGHTGRMELQKNHEFLIEVFAKLCEKNPNFKLLLVGEGSLKNKLKEKIEKLNIQNNVIFAGFVKNVNEYYSAFDIFILPSLFEGLSISLVEAQCNGLKCICSSNIDKLSDISGNVYFMNLNESFDNWVNIIEKNIERDYDILNHINKDFFVEKSIKKLEEYYKKYIND